MKVSVAIAIAAVVAAAVASLATVEAQPVLERRDANHSIHYAHCNGLSGAYGHYVNRVQEIPLTMHACLGNVVKDYKLPCSIQCAKGNVISNYAPTLANSAGLMTMDVRWMHAHCVNRIPCCYATNTLLVSRL
ncbi:hypothetical protein SYNPS1DRAFT_31663 [Syncephalis pseudoplumigaleata]|uniref:Uncharacterized protein n=1 Tax=Syncephalis pseudoplumigaleata TaxID=1712513 RepID=A0A4P9YU48_9FUNG|nr:hypothetical protein SYNPS1DRAFT_31663 [Syncephalis pseudoplumigaleata]|eukprot:RKP22711.1 hypothetical protein SYNPS1DRAFT_31663 [Syncephalis pseudoplumigaleata]